MDERIMEFKLQHGMCCSQILFAMILDDMGQENPQLIAAMEGLCNGLQEGKICGTLSGAACVLYMADRYQASLTMNSELMEWFWDTFGEHDCEKLLDGNPMNKVELCPVIIEQTYEKVLELLEDNNVVLR